MVAEYLITTNPDTIEEQASEYDQYYKEDASMNRAATETLLIAKAEELYSLYKKYNPNGEHLSIGISDEFITINNTYWRDDKERPIDVIKRDGKVMSRDH